MIGRAQSWQSAWSVAVQLPWATSGNKNSSLQARAGIWFLGELVLPGGETGGSAHGSG